MQNMVRPEFREDIRDISPSETWGWISPLLLEYGIVRVAKQTGFDRLGLPVYTATRPDAKSISIHQGKGLDDVTAQVGAAMEAIEFAIAESPEIEPYPRQVGELLDSAHFTPFEHLMPRDWGMEQLQTDQPMAAFKGTDFYSGETTWALTDVVDFDPNAAQLPQICKSTNGLASGNSADEAICHALCELIERDAETLWWLSSFERKAQIAVKAQAFQEPHIEMLERCIAQAGMKLFLFDVTSDIEVPSFLAMIYDETSVHHPIVYGYATHVWPEIAVVKAIMEAVQSRVGWLTGARDDLESHQYGQSISALEKQLMNVQPASGLRRQYARVGADLSERLDHVKAVLSERSISMVHIYPLARADRPFAVVKVIAPQLEAREPNLNWRAGPRARAVLNK